MWKVLAAIWNIQSTSIQCYRKCADQKQMKHKIKAISKQYFSYMEPVSVLFYIHLTIQLLFNPNMCFATKAKNIEEKKYISVLMNACKCDYIEWNSIFDFNKINVFTISLYYIAFLISQIRCDIFFCILLFDLGLPPVIWQIIIIKIQRKNNKKTWY